MRTGLALALTCVVLIIVLTPLNRASEVVAATESPSLPACSLTKAGKREAVLAWEAMMPVFRHPRCTNCHGGVNPAVPFTQGGHRGGAVADTATCADCHSLLPGWRVPAPVLHFTTKTDKELCIFIKRIMPQGPHIFVEHIQFEPFVPPFIVQAFKGDKALNTLGAVTLMDDFGIQAQAEPPPGSHAGLIQLANDWGRKVGRAWADSPECGCELDGAWVGTVKARGTFVGFGGVSNITVTSRADVVLDVPETTGNSSPGRMQNYRSIAGSVRWDMLASGNCTGNAGGTMPLDTTDVDGNPMGELRIEDLGNGLLSYQPTTTSNPEQWAPVFLVTCNISGTKVDLPITNPLPAWWHYDVPNYMTSTDPSRLKGSYRWEPAPGSVVIWEWDLERK